MYTIDKIDVGSAPRRVASLFGLAFALVVLVTPAGAEEEVPNVGNDSCLECHSNPALTTTLEDGDVVSLYIESDTFHASVHGEAGYACVQCHTDLGQFPHPPFIAENRRDLSLQLNTVCQRCHPGEYARALDSAHEQARTQGIEEAAICTDCHGDHSTRRLTDPDTGDLLPESRIWIPEACALCHSAIYEKYLTSVHGESLVREGNRDVPTCIDCHGVHNIEGPRTTTFRLKSPLLCANCHADPGLMDKYDLSTDVLETYVADFHGTTVTLFEKQSPDAETNKPVCFDCHGVHDIQRTADPEKGLQIRENLLARCQVCHPDATTDFPDAWMSHYRATPEEHPLVFAVELFYKILIPVVLSGMGLLVVLDFSWRVRNRAATRKAPKSGGSEPVSIRAADESENLDNAQLPEENTDLEE